MIALIRPVTRKRHPDAGLERQHHVHPHRETSNLNNAI